MNSELSYRGKRYRLLTKILCLKFLLFFTLIVDGQNSYIEPVSIPAYNSSNSEHYLISTVADWSHINDSDKSCFYVMPGTGYGTITITAEGTPSAKRYISLYNGNDTHPAKLSESQQANVRLVFNDAHYWVVDRMSSIDYNTMGCGFILENNTGNVILNRLHLTGFFDGIGLTGTDVAPYTSDNTIQYCRFDQMSASGIDGDAVAIIMTGGPTWNTPGTIMNTKILNNEIKNCNDGIQTLKMAQFVGDGTYYVDYPGTIMDGNHIYVDSTLYTDGTGTYDTDGLWALTENGIDLKGGSGDSGNPMIISNNFIWGFRRTDTNGGGSGSWGGAIDGHFHVQNVEIVNNVVFDSNQGITFSDTYGTTPYSIEDGLISGNILYNIGFETSGGTDFTSFFYDSKNVAFEENTIVGVDKNSRWFSHDYSEVDMNVSCNLVIDSYEMSGSRTSTTTVGNNSHFNTILQQSSDGVFYSSASDANMSNLSFTTDQFTNSPRSITLPGVVLSGSTPHAAACFTSLPALPGQAGNPAPADNATGLASSTDLSWTAGTSATTHDVYFGTANPPAFVLNQAGLSYDPGTLSSGTSYYWRIDEKNSAGTTTGTAWSFTTGTDTTGSLPSPGNILGHWELDNDVSDASGNGEDGIAHTVSFSTDAKIGSHSADFTGGYSLVELPTDISQADIKTICFWMKREGDNTGGASYSYALRKGELHFRIDNDGDLAFQAGNVSVTELTYVSNNTWIHIAGVIDGTSVKLYADGTLLGSGTGTTGLTSTSDYFGIAGYYNGDWGTFNGKIDDVIIWDTALDSSEIQSAMTHGGGVALPLPGQASVPSPSSGATDQVIETDLSWTAGSDATSHDVYFGTTNPPAFVQNQTGLSYDPGTLTSATTYYWRIDEKNATGTTTGIVWSFTTETATSIPLPGNILGYWELDNDVSDASGNGEDGIAHTVSFSTDAKIGSHSADFTGGYSLVELPTDISQADIKTICFWMKREGDNTGGAGYSYALRKGELHFRIDNDGDLAFQAGNVSVTELTYVSNNTWIHIAGVIDGTSVKLYADGTLLGSSTGTTGLTNTTDYFGIAGYYNGDWGTFNGKIDDVIIWNTALDQSDILDVMTHSGGVTLPLPGQASVPSPSSGATDQLLTTGLSWTAGNDATSHDVYFGTANPPVFIQNQTGLSYDPGTLSSATTYFWRIDEKNATGTTTGTVWSYTTETTTSLPLSGNILGHWELDNDVSDASGNGEDGIAHTVSFSTDAQIGSYSGDFTGGYSLVELPTDISQADIKTLCFWMKREGDNTGGAGYSYALRKGELHFRIDNDGDLAFQAGNVSVTELTYVSNNTWIHIAGVIDGTSVKLYADGTLLGSSTGTTGLTNTTDYFGIAGYYNGDWGTFNGKIDDVIIWNTALDQSDILDVMSYDVAYKSAGAITQIENFSLKSDGVSVQNFPNPFQISTNIQYYLPEEAHVQIMVYDISGTVVSSLVNTVQQAGENSVEFNAEQFESGIYFYRFKAGNCLINGQMMIIK